MSRRPIEPLARDIDELLANERAIVPESDERRARILARARAAWHARLETRSTGVAWIPWRGGARGLAVAFALVALAALSWALYGSWRSDASPVRAPAAPPHSKPPPVLAESSATKPPDPAPPSRADLDPEPKEKAATKRSPTRPDGPLELSLLQSARAAVARSDFPAALDLLGEHARHFPASRFGEEREALRIRALEGMGRAQEAQKASALFRARFPRSVLLPRIDPKSRSRP